MPIDIILCHPQHPGNIGFTARAMKTMGFKNLYVISETEPDWDAASITAVEAKDLLPKRCIAKSLMEILDKYHFLVAFTARYRRFRNHIQLLELPSLITSQSPQNRIGLVFGRESSGLTNEEIASCQCVVSIPTSTNFHSLNLSHAVQVACYELIRSLSPENTSVKKRRLATSMEREKIFDKLAAACKKISLNQQDADKTAKIFRILFEEKPLQKREAGALHRFFDQVVHGKYEFTVKQDPKPQ